MEVFVKNYRAMRVILLNKYIQHHNEQLPKDIWGLNVFADETDEELVDKIFMKRDFERELEFFNENDISAIKRDTLSHNSFLQSEKKTKKAAAAPVSNPPSLDWLRQVLS